MMWRRLVACLLMAGMLMSWMPAVKSIAAEPVSLSLKAALRALQQYGVVDSRPESELRLGDGITRAEVAKLLGAALGLQEAAAAGGERPAFPDTAGHWANGWIGLARDQGLFLGRDGGFHPQEPVTYAELMTALLRLVGRGEMAARDWPWGALTTAVDLGMVPTDLGLAGRWQEPAMRGDVFRLLAIAAGRVKLPGSESTLFQSRHDAEPPLLVLDGFPATATARLLTVTGSAGDAVEVRVGGLPAELGPSGVFSATLELAAGETPVAVSAADGAGNRTEQTAVIAYLAATSLQVTPAALSLPVGGEGAVSAEFVEQGTGQRRPVDGAVWSFDTAALSLDPATGRLRALKPGELTVRAARDGLVGEARVTVAGEPARLEIRVDHPVLTPSGRPTALRLRLTDSEGRLCSSCTQSVQVYTVPTGAAAIDKASLALAGGEAVAYLAPGSGTGAFAVQAKISGQREILSPLMPIQVEPRRLTGFVLAAEPQHLPLTAPRPVEVTVTAVDQQGVPIAVTQETRIALKSGDEPVLKWVRKEAVIKAGTAASSFGGINGSAVSTGRAGSVTVSGTAPSGGTGSGTAGSGTAGTRLPVAPVTLTAAGAGELAGLRITVLQDVATTDELTAALVQVARLDAGGQVRAGDSTPVVLVSRSAGVTVSPISDSGGLVTFAVRSSTAGRVSLTAGVPGRPELNSAAAEVAFMQSGSGAKPVLRARATSVPAGEATWLYVGLEAGGGAVSNPGPPLIFDLQAAGATLSESVVILPSGATRSDEVKLTLPASARTVSVVATPSGGKPLSPVAINVTSPPATPAGTPPSGNNLTAQGPTGGTAVAGEETRVVVKARSAATPLTGSHAFTLRVRLNGQTQTQLPAGLSIMAGPVSAFGQTLRTSDGQLELWIRYTGSGTLEIEPVADNSATDAFDQWGVKGAAQATAGFTSVTARIAYQSGPLSQVVAAVEPNLAGGLHGVIRAARGRFALVKVTPADAFGNPTGIACEASLTQVGGVPSSSLAIRTPTAELPQHSVSVGPGGIATFQVMALDSTPARTEWMAAVVCGSESLTLGRPVVIESSLAGAPAPAIEFAGGDKSGSGALKAADTALLLRLGPSATTAAQAEVLLYEGSTLLGRFGPVQPGGLEGAVRTVSVPKSAFGSSARALSLKVRVNTGAFVSEDSGLVIVHYSP